jgi:DNA repair protein RadD
MPNLRETLARCGEETLSQIIGFSTIELIQDLGLGRVSPAFLSELIIDRFDPYNLLKDKNVRPKIIDALKRQDAERICQKLSIDDKAPYQSLKGVHFSRNKAAFEILLDEFSVSEPAPSNDAAPRPAQSATIPSTYPLFAHQRKVVRETIQQLNSENRRTLLHMPTGAGKTRTAMNVISDFLRNNENKVVVWLAYSEELCDQAAKEFETSWASLGDRDVTISRHYGSFSASLSEIDDGVLITGLSKMYSSTQSRDRDFFTLSQKVGLVIIDEAHMAIADTYQHVLDMLAPTSNVPLLGLTATPGRSWLDVGEDERLADFFGRSKVSLEVEGFDNPVDFLQAEGYLSEVVSEPLYYNGVSGEINVQQLALAGSSFDLSDAVLKSIGEDQKRNLLIIHKAVDELKGGAKLILFACSVDHANVLAIVLKLKGYDARAVTSLTSDESRRDAITSFRNDGGVQALTNYGVLTTGFDAPKANVALVARPTQSVVLYSQMVGRVARGEKAGGTSSCKVITVVDQVLGFRDMGEAFTFWDDLWD